MSSSHPESTTLNGHEIAHPVDVLSASEFKAKLEKDYGIDGTSPAERLTQIKSMSVEGIAILLEDINKSVQGSRDSLMNHEGMTTIGEIHTLAPEDRYEVFLHVVNRLKHLDANVSPARAMDTLALAVVMLHPFHDGNGRTARVIGTLGREDYDDPDFLSEGYSIVIGSREEARKKGGVVLYGYVPHMPSGFDRSKPTDVMRYLDSLLEEDRQNLYVGCYGQAPLHEKEA